MYEFSLMKSCILLKPELGILGHEIQFDHIFSSRSREKILVTLTGGPQNDFRGHKNIVEKNYT
jgi:hypothetical protein